MEPHLARLAEKKRAATEGPASGTSAPAHVNGNGHAALHQQSQPQQPSPPQHQEYHYQQRPQQQPSPVSPPPISPTTTMTSSATAASVSPVFPPPQDLHLGDLYADVDVTQLALQMGVGSPGGAGADAGAAAGGPSWDALFSAPAGDSGGLFGGPLGGGDLTGMMGDECLAAMMGLGSEAWFMPGVN